MKPVMIEWIDSSAYNAQVSSSFAFKLFLWKSMGFLIESSKEKVVICQSMEPSSDQVTGVISVPRKNITKMKVLRGESK